MENDFLNRITEIIKENISNEKFGVSELAHEMSMSRSNLLRKINKLTKLSVSQYIRQVRLQQALEMLRQTSLNVSEVSYRVGFGSTSYFIKCFREYFGYPPGKVGNRDLNGVDSIQTVQSMKKKKIVIIGLTIIIVLLATVLSLVFKPFSSKQKDLEKSIAVLPFKNDSNDSTNIYIINGLMEAILNNLQKIEDLRVISRTSVEQYRNIPITIPEIARELNVNYFVEGSGQKVGDQILLNIQLIEASSDKHLLSEQYIREARDIFQLQMEVAKNIAGKIQVIITPEEEERINKIPTGDLVAYDYYLKGLDLMYKGDRESLKDAISYFNNAIEHDREFALAYADLAITYYLLDLYQAEKKYSVQINNNADKALLFDPQLAQSLIAKAMYYITNEEYEQAVTYLEKALEYNPNSALVINILSDFYTNYIPNTERYLEYALKGISLDIAAHDSITASYIYLNISSAFIQSGFLNEAERYVYMSSEYNPDNLYAEYLKAYILYARNKDLRQTKELLIKAFIKDTTRLDIMQEIGKICYYMRDYESAYYYYNKFIKIKKDRNLDVYPGENAKIGLVLSIMGLKEESEKIFKDYKNYAENDISIYKHLSLAVYYSYKGDTENAIDHLKLFSQQSNYHYWLILFLEIDPLIDNIKDHPEFKSILSELEIKFWGSHERIKASLTKKGLL